jgi:transposase
MHAAACQITFSPTLVSYIMEYERQQQIITIYEAGLNGYAIFQRLKNLPLAKSTIYSVISQYKEHGTI